MDTTKPIPISPGEASAAKQEASAAEQKASAANKSYTLHLGFNWYAPPIGQNILGKATTPALYDLQYALADTTPLPDPANPTNPPRSLNLPTWFTRFHVGDTLSFQIWDLTPTTGWASPAVYVGGVLVTPSITITLKIATSALNGGEIINPGTLFNSTDTNITQPDVLLPDLSKLPVFLISNVTYTTGSISGCPWPSVQAYSSLIGPLSFIKQTSFNMSFGLTVVSGTTKQYVSDPETIVGAAGSGN